MTEQSPTQSASIGNMYSAIISELVETIQLSVERHAFTLGLFLLSLETCLPLTVEFKQYHTHGISHVMFSLQTPQTRQVLQERSCDAHGDLFAPLVFATRQTEMLVHRVGRDQSCYSAKSVIKREIEHP